MDRQVDKQDRAEVTRFSVQTIAFGAAAVEGKVEHVITRMVSDRESVYHCVYQI